MANNYLLFLEAIKDLTPEEEDWLRQRCDEGPTDDPDGYDAYNFEAYWRGDKNDRRMLIQAGESGNPEHVGNFVREFFQKFRPQGVFTLTWASYCNRMNIGEFGGGAMVVKADTIETMNTWDWAKTSEESESTCDGRSQKVETLISRFYPNYIDAYDGPIEDVLADIRHFCDAHGLDFGDLDRAAYRQYSIEATEEKKIRGSIV